MSTLSYEPKNMNMVAEIFVYCVYSAIVERARQVPMDKELDKQVTVQAGMQ